MVTPGGTKFKVSQRQLTDGSAVWEVCAYDSHNPGNWMLLARCDTELEAITTENAIFLATQGH